MSDASTPRTVSGFNLQQLDDDMLLYHPGLTKTIHLNETASLIWQLCDGVRSTGDIILALQEAFPEHREEIPADVTAALRKLRLDGAIEFV